MDMHRHGLLVTLLTAPACSVPNPFFDVVSEGSSSSTDASTTTQGVTSEPTTGATSGATGGATGGATSGPTTDEPVTSTSTSESTGLITTTEATTSEPETVCGDGMHEGAEECDDGNMVDNDVCSNDCTLPECGDGFVQVGEPCDDGNVVEDDECHNDCTLPMCGDGIEQPGEPCDDGNQTDNDACTDDCTEPACGDGIVQDPEACDDGNADNTDDCLVGCTVAECGDEHVQAGVEACDDGNASNFDECTNDCLPAECGDGFAQLEEQCDFGADTDTCQQCMILDANNCNNLILEPDEECDPTVAPFKGLPGLCDPEDCTITGCFRVHNTGDVETEFVDNSWLDECTTAPGQTVVVALLNEMNKVTYLAKGIKVGMWTMDNVTAGTAVKALEYDVGKHSERITMNRILPNDGMDVLMVTSQIAAQAGPYNCHTSLGDGYGVAIFPSIPLPKVPKLLVMGYKGGNSMNPRAIKGFTASTEISYNPIGMDVCGVGVTPFSGTFILSVLP